MVQAFKCYCFVEMVVLDLMMMDRCVDFSSSVSLEAQNVETEFYRLLARTFVHLKY